MKRIVSAGVTAVLILCFLTGCSRRAARSRPEPIDITVERICEQSSLVVVRAHIVFPDEHKVRLWQKSDAEEMTVQADSKTGLAECEVLLVADVVNVGESSRVKWLHAIQSRGGLAGGPATHVVPKDSKLGEMLQISLQPGAYRFGEEIEVAVFRDEPLRLRID